MTANARISKLQIAGLITLSTAFPMYVAAQQSQSAAQQSEQQGQQGQQSQSSQRQSEQDARTDAAPADGTSQQSGAGQQPNPYLRADDSWISISGTVEIVRPHAFTLSYGDGIVTVEMDDGDRDADAYSLVQGDKVTVYGFIDDDLFETTSIEASSVYVEKLGTYFYASALDEEDYHVVSVTPPMDPSSVSVSGRVSAVSSGDEFTIDTGVRSIVVDVDEMSYNPLDDEGYQKVEIGDIVSVVGQIDDGFFEGRELKARTITTLMEEFG